MSHIRTSSSQMKATNSTMRTFALTDGSGNSNNPYVRWFYAIGRQFCIRTVHSSYSADGCARQQKLIHATGAAAATPVAHYHSRVLVKSNLNFSVLQNSNGIPNKVIDSPDRILFFLHTHIFPGIRAYTPVIPIC